MAHTAMESDPLERRFMHVYPHCAMMGKVKSVWVSHVWTYPMTNYDKRRAPGLNHGTCMFEHFYK